MSRKGIIIVCAVVAGLAALWFGAGLAQPSRSAGLAQPSRSAGLAGAGPLALPSGAMVLGLPNDSGLTDAGYAELGASNVPYELWRSITTTNAPTARHRHTAVWTGSEMLVWGGYGPSPPYRKNDGGGYEPSTDTWTAITTTNAPSGRNMHTAVWTGSEMLVWGGYGSGARLNDGGGYEPSTDTWTAITTANGPTGRSGHSAVWTGSEMLVWGGDDGGYSNTGGRYDPSTDTWTPISTTNAPSARERHTGVWTGSEMLVWGGVDPGYSNTGGRYDPSTDTWTAITTTNAPSGRYDHTAVWTGSEMLVWGGEDPGYSNTGGRYDPSTDTWTPIATANAPAGRFGHTAVWTGSEMLVWGGEGSSPRYRNDGGRYAVLELELAVAKSVAPTISAPLSRVTYTIVISNSGPFELTGAVVSDTLPAELTFAGPVALDPPTAGTTGTPPLLVSGATITASTSITVTFPVTVNTWLATGTVITNTAAVTSNEVTTPLTASVGISVANAKPQLGAVHPSSGSGPTGVTAYFTTTWKDDNCWQDLKHNYFHMGASPSISGNVTLLYNSVKNKLWLRNDDGTAWTGGCAPGSWNILENSQTRVYCVATTAQGEGDTLEVRWLIEFKPGYTGAKKLGLKCKDRSKARAKGKWKGTWTITP
jgi:uncharacterized repeat protein (TIGR01451 family)